MIAIGSILLGVAFNSSILFQSGSYNGRAYDSHGSAPTPSEVREMDYFKWPDGDEGADGPSNIGSLGNGWGGDATPGEDGGFMLDGEVTGSNDLFMRGGNGGDGKKGGDGGDRTEIGGKGGNGSRGGHGGTIRITVEDGVGIAEAGDGGNGGNGGNGGDGIDDPGTPAMPHGGNGGDSGRNGNGGDAEVTVTGDGSGLAIAGLKGEIKGQPGAGGAPESFIGNDNGAGIDGTASAHT